MKKLIESMDQIEECGMSEMPAAVSAPAPENPGNPVTVSVTMNASGKEHVDDLINMMKNAGMSAAEPVSAKTLSPRMDMERLTAMMDEPEMSADEAYADEMMDDEDETLEAEGDYANEPEEEYQDHTFMTKDLSGGLNREKKAYKAAQDGDNAMAVEAIKSQLMTALEEKKAKPDFLDVDKDGDKKEPMKKAIKDKGSKPKKGKVPPQFAKKKTNEAELDEISSDLAKRYTKSAKMDRDFNDDDIDRLAKSGQSTQDMHRRNAKRTKGINRAKKRMD